MGVNLNSFAQELKKFFEDVEHFLTETVEGYSMSGEDDNERDGIMANLKKLQNMMHSLPGVALGDNSSVKGEPVCDEEYLAPTDVSKTNTDDGIMEDTYEDPNSKTETMTEDIYDDTENAITDDFYEDPYADGKRKLPQSPNNNNYKDNKIDEHESSDEGEGIMEDTYEDTTMIEDTKKVNKTDAKQDKHDKKEKADKKDKKKKERNASDTKSTGSNEEITYKDIAASELVETEIEGFLRKQKEKNSLIKRSRWCAVKDKLFYYFESQKSKKQKGQISLEEYEASMCMDEVQRKKYVFQLTCPGKKSYYFSTNKESDMKQWVHFLQHGTIYVPSKKEPEKEPETVQASDDEDGELYEDTEPPVTNGSKPSVTEEEDAELMDEVYENPDDLVRDPIPNVSTGENGEDEEKPYQDRGPPPPVPSKQDVKEESSTSSRNPLPPIPVARKPVSNKELPLPPPPPDPEEDDEDEEYYDDADSQPVAARSGSIMRDKSKKDNIDTTPRISSLPAPPPELTNFTALYYGLWPCHNVPPDQLEFDRGNTIEIVNKSKYDNYGWWVGKLGSKVGLVPKNYLTPMYKEV